MILPYYISVFLICSIVSSLPVYPDRNSNRSLFETEVGNSSTDRLKPKAPNGAWRIPRLQAVGNGYNSNMHDMNSQLHSRGGVKRGVDIGIHLNAPKNSNNDNLNKLKEILEKAVGGSLAELGNSSACPKCDEEEDVPGVPSKRRIKPAYKCDDWDAKLRLCILERNIGDTITFYLSTGHLNHHKPGIIWQKEFHMQDEKARTEYVIDPDNPPQNIIIGKQGYELRISPITEIDIGSNLFSATLRGYSSAQGKVYFVIRIVPIDLGFVYVGETIELNLRSYASFPLESLFFRWYMEKYGEHGTLPSNMRISASGSSIKISELRQEQEGVLSCSAYSNLGFLATKRRFIIKDLIKNKDVLESAPDHNLTFTEEQPDRKKRYPKKFTPFTQNSSKRAKRNVNAVDLVEKALMEPTLTKNPGHIKRNYETSTHPMNDYNSEMDAENEGLRSNTLENFSDDIDSRYQDLDEDLQQPYDYSVDAKPMEVPETGENDQRNYHAMNTYEGVPAGEQESSLLHRSGGKPLSYYATLEESGSVASLPRRQEQASDTSMKTVENNRKYGDVDIENKKDYNAQTKESEVILNIDKIPGPRRISAEENLSKLISFCYTDFECSGEATCVRSNLKQKGFCKCLPGFYGVGIFCRESIWLSNGNFEVDEMPIRDYVNVR